MSFYSIALFLHITGALGIFVGIGLEWLIVHNFQKVTTNSQALQWTGLFKVLPVTFLISGILILFPGIYMSVEVWGMSPWIISGLTLYLFLAVFGGKVVGKKIGSIRSALESEGEKLSDAILKEVKSPIIVQSLKIRTALALSIIFMMTIKPGWAVTLVSIGVALIIGFLLTKIIK